MSTYTPVARYTFAAEAAESAILRTAAATDGTQFVSEYDAETDTYVVGRSAPVRSNLPITWNRTGSYPNTGLTGSNGVGSDSAEYIRAVIERDSENRSLWQVRVYTHNGYIGVGSFRSQREAKEVATSIIRIDVAGKDAWLVDCAVEDAFRGQGIEVTR